MAPLHGHSDSEADEFRKWLFYRHGADFDATDERLEALLLRARAKCEALGWGGVFGVAETMLLEQVRP